TDGGHLRIEMRALPSGPTTFDMMANAAFFVGLTMAMRDHMPDILPSMPFRFAEHNFYRAAQNGLDAHILWPERGQNCPKEQPVNTVIKSLLPQMVEGLDRLGLDGSEIEKYRSNVEDRLNEEMTGARWQLMMLEKYTQLGASRTEACHAMTQKYIEQQESGKSLIEWSLTP
ncbi:MAG: hypothetical protein L3J50_08440, partial [Emcibacter sp.]|nr:hypothetical protein [Emcibacter sp.]